MWAWVRIRLLLWQSDFFIVPFLCWNYYPQGDFIASLINSPVPFAYESDLRDYLAKNLQIIESGLRLYEEEGITGIEFPVGGRFIDILAIDSNGDFVVIELKVSRGYDRVIGQILRYMAWIEQNQANIGQKVRGIIVARKISEDLMLACSLMANIDLFEYELSLSLKRVHPSIRKDNDLNKTLL
jgi:RecB family endonuclease NucS